MCGRCLKKIVSHFDFPQIKGVLLQKNFFVCFHILKCKCDCGIVRDLLYLYNNNLYSNNLRAFRNASQNDDVNDKID